MKDYKRLTTRANETTVLIDTRKFNLEDGLTEGAQEWEATKKMVFRLAELEDKIENGTLVELPCKVGDVLYYVNKYETTPRIEENKVHTIEIYECMDGLTIRIWTQNGTFYADKMPNVFPTKAEAEAKLLQLKGAKQ